MKLCKNSANPFVKRMSDGPVDWKIWDAETIQGAAALDRPICLCIINNSSRWSLAMKEIFLEPDVVNMLNHDFVSVMADNADVPHLTLAARAMAQIMLGHAGWPLFLFLTPEKKPIFASSYMPRSSENTQMPGILEVLRRIKWLWLMKRTELNKGAESFAEQLREALLPYTADLNENLAQRAADQLLLEADMTDGGFGNAPKFPQANKLILAMRLATEGVENEKLSSLTKNALNAMFCGALYDHVRGGFHDYCADKKWTRPYLGKHLSQNIAVINAYLEGYSAFSEPLYKNIVEKSLKVLSEEFSDGCGLLCSGEDIHDESSIDAFYLWTEKELSQVIDVSANDFAAAYGITERGNYLDPLSGRETEKNLLLLYQNLSDAETLYKAEMSFAPELAQLAQARDTLSKPRLEGRVLIRENAAFAALLAKASRVFACDSYLKQAEAMFDILLVRATHDGKLCHSLYGDVRDGEAVLDDIASIASAALELYKGTTSEKWLEKAKSVCHLADDLFGADGAMRLVAEGIEEILPAWDGGDDFLPSGNAVMLENLITLYKITGNKCWKTRAQKIVDAFGGALNEYPAACAALTCGALRLAKCVQ